MEEKRERRKKERLQGYDEGNIVRCNSDRESKTDFNHVPLP